MIADLKAILSYRLFWWAVRLNPNVLLDLGMAEKVDEA